MSTITAPHERADFDAAGDRRSALALSLLLLTAGVLVAFSPLLGVVRTADGSEIEAAVAAGFVAVVPGLLALLLTIRGPALGLAATAGAGLIGMVRLLTDLAVLTEADRITRPELFAETTERARPFTAGAGGWVLLAADVLWLVVGVAAAVRLTPALAGSLAPPSDGFFGRPAAEPAQGVAADDEPVQATVVGAALGRSPPGRRSLNLPMIAAGFLGSILLMIGALGTPYQGGYLALRVLPFGSSLTGLVAAALLGFLTAVVVVVAAALPRAIATALLAGTAVGAAVPSVTAIVAVGAGAPTGLSPVVWCGVAGALVLGASALLTHRGAADSRSDGPDDAPPPAWLSWGTGAAAVLGAAALLAAWQSPLLYLDGVAPDEIIGGALLPAALPHLVAAVPLGVCGVLALLPPLAAAGRAALTVAWAGAVYAFGQALSARSLVLSTAGDPAGGSAGTEHSWTTGPGQWFSIIGAVLAVTAAVLAALTARRSAEASLEVVDDSTLSASRAARVWPAIALTVFVVVALAVPAYSDLTGSGPSLLQGYDLHTWGFWALAIGAMIGIGAAALTARAAPAGAWLVAAAAVVAQPVAVPASVRAAPGFGFGVGLWLILAAAVALLAGAWRFAALARRVQVSTVPPALGGLGRASDRSAGKDVRRPGPRSSTARGAATNEPTGTTQDTAGSAAGQSAEVTHHKGSGRSAQPKGR